MLSALRAAVRIARRDAWRARGRSTLVVAMIALPVMGATVIDVIARTKQLDPPEVVQRELGAAQARVEQPNVGVTGQTPGAIVQTPAGNYAADDRRLRRRPLLDVLPAKSRILPDISEPTVVRTDDGLAGATVRELDYADPIARGLVHQIEGRAPHDRGEVALSPELARKAGLEVGGTLITRDPERELRVVGIAEAPATSDAGTAFARPGAVPGRAGGTIAASRAWLVASPRPISWERVKRMNRSGFLVKSRAVLLDPPPPAAVAYQESASGDGDLFAGGALAVGLVLLEVVLLAGPPFAVAVRRRQRDLALIAATGGGREHVRAVVLAEGLVLGLAAGMTGALVGIVTAALTKPWFAKLAGAPLGRLDVRPLDLAAIASVGVLAAVLAALLPARTAARQDVVTALAGRRPVAPARRRTSLAGTLVAAAGTAIAAVGAGARNALVVFAGAALAEVGVLLLLPMLVAGAGRLARFLPVAPRLALRDAARNRARTVPAIAAITAAVAGCAAAGVVVSSQAAQEKASYSPSARAGQVRLEGLDSLPRGSSREHVASAVARELPARGSHVLRQPACDDRRCVSVSPSLPRAQRCPLEDGASTPAQVRRYANDPRCDGGPSFESYQSDALVDDGSSLQALTGVRDPAAVRMLRSGRGVVALDGRYVVDGRLRFEYGPDEGPSRHAALPAVALGGGFKPTLLVIAPRVARRLHIPLSSQVALIDTGRMPTEAEEESATAALDRVAPGATLSVERGFQSAYDVGLLALLVAAAVVTLAAAAIATGLAGAEALPDLATLAAVGASPRTRRLLSASRSLVIAGIGTATGVVVGLVPGVAAVHAIGVQGESGTLTIPWTQLALAVLALPLLAALLTGAATRSRVALTRRIA